MDSEHKPVGDVVHDLRTVQHCACGDPVISVPLLKCARCGKVHPARCFYYRAGGAWVAECLDFDLISEGTTAEDAIGRLQEAIYGYLETVTHENECAPVSRPAPLSHWIRYRWHALARWLRRRSGMQGACSPFTVPGRLIERRFCA